MASVEEANVLKSQVTNRLLHASHIQAKFTVSTFVGNINYGITRYIEYRAYLSILLAICNEFTKSLNMEVIEGTKHRRLWGGEWSEASY